MTQPYHPEDGTDPVTIDASTIKHVRSLEDLTGRTTHDLLDEAVRLLKESMVPSTKPAAVKRGTKKVAK